MAPSDLERGEPDLDLETWVLSGLLLLSLTFGLVRGFWILGLLTRLSPGLRLLAFLASLCVLFLGELSNRLPRLFALVVLFECLLGGEASRTTTPFFPRSLSFFEATAFILCLRGFTLAVAAPTSKLELRLGLVSTLVKVGVGPIACFA